MFSGTRAFVRTMFRQSPYVMEQFIFARGGQTWRFNGFFKDGIFYGKTRFEGGLIDIELRKKGDNWTLYCNHNDLGTGKRILANPSHEQVVSFKEKSGLKALPDVKLVQQNEPVISEQVPVEVLKKPKVDVSNVQLPKRVEVKEEVRMLENYEKIGDCEIPSHGKKRIYMDLIKKTYFIETKRGVKEINDINLKDKILSFKIGSSNWQGKLNVFVPDEPKGFIEEFITGRRYKVGKSGEICYSDIYDGKIPFYQPASFKNNENKTIMKVGNKFITGVRIFQTDFNLYEPVNLSGFSMKETPVSKPVIPVKTVPVCKEIIKPKRDENTNPLDNIPVTTWFNKLSSKPISRVKVDKPMPFEKVVKDLTGELMQEYDEPVRKVVGTFRFGKKVLNVYEGGLIKNFKGELEEISILRAIGEPNVSHSIEWGTNLFYGKFISNCSKEVFYERTSNLIPFESPTMIC